MYTLVLMSALAGGPEATRFDGWGGGCYGSCYGSGCVGASYACYGGGCYGRPLFPRARAVLSGVADGVRGAFAPLGTHRSSGCQGGYASCYGSSSGCYGSSAGCFGSCHGCSGGVYYGSAVYGGCYGSSSAGGFGGGCFGAGYVVGGGGCIGYAAALPSIPAIPLAADIPTSHMAMKPAAESTVAALVVSLPAAAKLYVDGQLVAGDGPNRRFHTPPLAAGPSYYYEMKAEVMVGGKVEVEEAKVVIRAGDTKDVAFGRLTALAAGGGSLAAR